MASIAEADALDLAAIRLFLDVVELSSVSKAAARHRLAQPSATAKLQKLERLLGVQLLDRGPTGSAATTAGIELAPACAELVASAVALIARGDDLQRQEGRLAIATTPHVADHFLPEWIATWTATTKEVAVDLVEADTRAVAAAVRSSEVALGFTDGPNPPIGLRSVVVATEAIVAVVGPGHRWAQRVRSIRANQLVTDTFVVTQSGSGTLDVIEHAIASRGLAVDGPRHEVSGSAAARVAAINGAGVAFLPRCRVARDLTEGRLRELTISDLTIEQPVRAVWRGSTPNQLPARRLLDSLPRGPRSAGPE